MHIKTVGNRLTIYLAENDKNVHVDLISVLIENLLKFKYERLWYNDSNRVISEFLGPLSKKIVA